MEESNVEFIKAFLKAQMTFESVEKDATNPFFKSKYSTYKAVSKAVRPSLNREGITISHSTEYIGEVFVLRTTLEHISGGKRSSIHPVKEDKNGTIQSMGSGESYAKRYNLIALTGVEVYDENDDDGEYDRKQKANKASSSKPARYVVPNTNTISTNETDEIMTFGKYKGKSLPEIPAEYCVWLINSFTPKTNEEIDIINKLKSMHGVK